uniref:GTD-binding domain-containing protein n=1 Tax=Phaseolus vulgaris TaxID=3885 RepID=V7CLV8_PHAVU|nr:hypothetical protein PHAVU_002G214800g [Phaseolus vulgaris]ESW31162.1 hypothetical protein PHAVU_002G214800g [Phaseolus vulgaris]
MDFPPALNLLTQFGCGFVLLRSLSRVFNFLGLFLMLTFWFKVWRFGWNSKSAIRFICASGGVPKVRFCLDRVAWEVFKAKTGPLKKARRPRSSSSIRKRSNGSRQRANAGSEDGSEVKGENEREVGNEEEEFDVMTLRKLVKTERVKANAACTDLETERTAAASSAEEAMAMILRLQNEKSAAEIQATQFRRMAEQKLDYDQEVIESLQWTITQHEVQKCDLEDQVEICREDLRQFMRDEDIEKLEVEVSRDYMYDEEEEGGGGGERGGGERSGGGGDGGEGGGGGDGGSEGGSEGGGGGDGGSEGGGDGGSEGGGDGGSEGGGEGGGEGGSEGGGGGDGGSEGGGEGGSEGGDGGGEGGSEGRGGGEGGSEGGGGGGSEGGGGDGDRDGNSVVSSPQTESQIL